jgi:hypothetical protein
VFARVKALVFFFIYAIVLRVRIFKYKWFHRFADKEGITDNELKEIVKQLEKGQFYADLGGGVYKMQLARSGEGKSGGYRVIVIFKSEFRTFFTYCFPKSKRDNIEDDELRFYKKQAKKNLALTEEQIDQWLIAQTLIEVEQGEENEIQK